MEAITREEKLLSGQQLEPITRKELFLAKAAGMDVQTPEPITREEIFLSQISGGGGGAEPAVIEPLSVTANGTYNPPDGVDGYSPVSVTVPVGDEWKEQYIRMIERDSSNPVTELPDGLTKIGMGAFDDNSAVAFTVIPASVKTVARNIAPWSSMGPEITFEGKPDTINSGAFLDTWMLEVLNVPWAEGEVANAPWGATNATINYNYTGG